MTSHFKKEIALLLTALAFTAGCGKEPPAGGEGKISVVVSFGAMEKLTEAIGGDRGGLVSLGGYGGYITFHFDHPVVNVSGEADFLIRGNAFEGNSEPGIVMVSEDVNGNGRKDFADVVLYFNQMTWIAANEPVSAFDYNGNGRIDFADVVWLFNAL